MQRFGFMLGLAALAGCVPSAGAADLSPAEETQARKLYHLKCAKCHKFYHPARYSVLDWEMWMEKMSDKAKLTPEQERLLSRYLETFRSDPKKRKP